MLWETDLRFDAVNFSIDPLYKNRILFFDNDKTFTISFLEDEGKSPPNPILDKVMIDTDSTIIDAQWSLHMPNYIFVMLEKELCYFNVELELLIPLIDSGIVPSIFDLLLQFPNDATKLMITHRNGMISCYEMNEDYNFFPSKDVQPITSTGCITGIATCPKDNEYVAFIHSTIGIALISTKTFKITSIDPIFPSDITAYDSDGTKYSTGSRDGYVMIGNLYDTTDTKRYKVSSETVKFVSFDLTSSKIYWQTESNIGFVDSSSQCVFTYKSYGKTTKHFGSHKGALIVQRDKQVLGVFIDGKEHVLILSHPVIDVAVDEKTSTQSNGKFYVLLKNHIIKLYTYSNKSDITPGYSIKPRTYDGDSLCLAYSDSKFATGYSNGILSLYDESIPSSRRIQTAGRNLRSLQFDHNSTTVFGLCNDSTLFRTDFTRIVFCPCNVLNYRVINESLLLIMSNNGVIKFININDWTPLGYVTNHLPPPTEDENLRQFIEHRQTSEFYDSFFHSFYPFDFQRNLRLNSIYGIGDILNFDEIELRYISRTKIKSENSKHKKLLSLIFLNEFDKASELLINEDSTTKSYFSDSILSTFILLSSSNDKLNDKTQKLIKNLALELFGNGKYNKAALLFKIAKMDIDGFKYFLECEQFEIAVKFIRNINDNELKKKFLFELGCKLFELNKLQDCVCVFAAANEFHPVLYILFSMGLITDAYFLMRDLLQCNMLKQLERKNSSLSDIACLDDVCNMIKNQFEKNLIRLELK
ncbi:hypothetical protein GPJ56_008219 [Histomonas meleagridis]|uniref:uncharacterized protein n=1 Tax=Histomonas meleagridis TaxID=135588 RepID=UPI003559C93A|nr:hypothetical protein GPJ56_008219 [Histomonas meleagridis]KAH0797240.1 hypothetical protein GO595_009922 [Histomonas meleagridis]